MPHRRNCGAIRAAEGAAGQRQRIEEDSRARTRFIEGRAPDSQAEIEARWRRWSAALEDSANAIVITDPDAVIR